MQRVARRPSHPVTGWSFVVLGTAGIVVGGAAWLARCGATGVAAWPVEGRSLELLADVVRVSVPAAVLLLLGVLLPLQALAWRPDRRDLLARTVTTAVLVVVGGAWMLRVNLVGYASLWARREPLGDLLLPAALLENRVWSANIMLVFAVALASLPLNTFVRRMLDRPGMRRAPWPLWMLGATWWVGLVAVLLIAGRP